MIHGGARTLPGCVRPGDADAKDSRKAYRVRTVALQTGRVSAAFEPYTIHMWNFARTQRPPQQPVRNELTLERDLIEMFGRGVFEPLEPIAPRTARATRAGDYCVEIAEDAGAADASDLSDLAEAS